MRKLFAQYLAEFNDITINEPRQAPLWWALFSIDALLVGGLVTAVWWAVK